MRTWKLTINEDELMALIDHHSENHLVDKTYSVERSSRIHDLTKRLSKKDEAEVEKEPEQNIKEIPVPSAWS